MYISPNYYINPNYMSDNCQILKGWEIQTDMLDCIG
jgi:hypothetical protein